MTDFGGLEKRTGKLIAWLSDRSQGGYESWWVIVAPSEFKKVKGNEYVEYGPLTLKQAQCRIIGIKNELTQAGWIEGP